MEWQDDPSETTPVGLMALIAAVAWLAAIVIPIRYPGYEAWIFAGLAAVFAVVMTRTAWNLWATDPDRITRARRE